MTNKRPRPLFCVDEEVVYINRKNEEEKMIIVAMKWTDKEVFIPSKQMYEYYKGYSYSCDGFTGMFAREATLGKLGASQRVSWEDCDFIPDGLNISTK